LGGRRWYEGVRTDLLVSGGGGAAVRPVRPDRGVLNMADFEALPAGSRRAMQLALEALEQCGLDDSQRRYHLEAEAKTTLRAMLGMASRPEAPMADHDHGRLMANLRDRRADLERQHHPGCSLLKIPSRDCDCSPDESVFTVKKTGTWTHWSTNPAAFELPDGEYQLYTQPPHREPADHLPTSGKMVTVEELSAALGLSGGNLDKAELLQRVSDLAAIGRRVLTALDHGWIEAPDQVADDLRSVLTPPADGRQEPSIATEEVRSCMTCAHILKGALEEPCARCSNGSHWERHASASGSALSRWVGEHRAAGST